MEVENLENFLTAAKDLEIKGLQVSFEKKRRKRIFILILIFRQQRQKVRKVRLHRKSLLSQKTHPKM